MLKEALRAALVTLSPALRKVTASYSGDKCRRSYLPSIHRAKLGLLALEPWSFQLHPFGCLRGSVASLYADVSDSIEKNLAETDCPKSTKWYKSNQTVVTLDERGQWRFDLGLLRIIGAEESILYVPREWCLELWAKARWEALLARRFFVV